MEDLLAAMERAADQLAGGRTPDEVSVGPHPLYVAEHGSQRGVVCILDTDSCYGLLESAATEIGIRLDDLHSVEVRLPKAEFGDDLVSGGFETWKGVSVEMRNEALEELLDVVFEKLRARGLTISIYQEEEVVFYLPLK